MTAVDITTKVAELNYSEAVKDRVVNELIQHMVELDSAGFEKLIDKQIAVNGIEKVITKKTKAILICNPNNPTGYAYSDDELERLKKIVLKHDLFLISDEVYRDFIYDDKQ